MANSEYTADYLRKEARGLVKGQGRFDGYSVVITANGTSLRAYYIARAGAGRQFVSIAL